MDWTQQWEYVARMMDEGRIDAAIDIARSLAILRSHAPQHDRENMPITGSIITTICRMADHVKLRVMGGTL